MRTEFSDIIRCPSCDWPLGQIVAGLIYVGNHRGRLTIGPMPFVLRCDQDHCHKLWWNPSLTTDTASMMTALIDVLGVAV